MKAKSKVLPCGKLHKSHTSKLLQTIGLLTPRTSSWFRAAQTETSKGQWTFMENPAAPLLVWEFFPLIFSQVLDQNT